MNIFTEITLWVRFTLLTRSAHGPGEDSFEAVMCTSGGCLSNLMNAYRRYLFLIQNITWISAGLYHTKRLSKRYTVARFIIRFQQKRSILLHGKKIFTRKSYCGHKLINFSYNVAIDRWAVVYRSMMEEVSKAYFVCLSNEQNQRTSKHWRKNTSSNKQIKKLSLLFVRKTVYSASLWAE